MTTAYKITLASGPQTFTASLGDRRFELTLTWKESAVNTGWYLDWNPVGGEGVKGVALVPGTDLFAQFQYLELGHLRASLPNPEQSEITYGDVGGQLTLIWWA